MIWVLCNVAGPGQLKSLQSDRGLWQYVHSSTFLSDRRLCQHVHSIAAAKNNIGNATMLAETRTLPAVLSLKWIEIVQGLP